MPDGYGEFARVIYVKIAVQTAWMWPSVISGTGGQIAGHKESKPRQAQKHDKERRGKHGMNGAGTAGAGDQHQQHMRTALTMAERSLAAGGAPVGACLIRDGQLVARAGNAVAANLDVTAHAEIELIRQACRELNTLSLADCQLYVTVQPCAMCLAACHYAGITDIYFGAGIEAMHRVTGNELAVGMQNADASGPLLTGGILAQACEALIERWSAIR